jgi:DNA mismatch repair protein PMS2
VSDSVPLPDSSPRASSSGVASKQHEGRGSKRLIQHTSDVLNEEIREPLKQSSPSTMPKKSQTPFPKAAISEGPSSQKGQQNAIQMVLSTAGASWSLDKNQDGRQDQSSKSTPYSTKPTRGRGAKKFTTTLSQFRRGVEAMESRTSEELDEDIEEFEEEDEVDEEDQVHSSMYGENEAAERSPQPSRSTSDRKQVLENLRNDRKKKNSGKSTDAPLEEKSGEAEEENDVEENFAIEAAPRRGVKRSRASSNASVPPTVISQMEDESEHEDTTATVPERATFLSNRPSKDIRSELSIQVPEPAPIIDSSAQMTQDIPLEIIRTNRNSVMTMECNLATISERWSAYSSRRTHQKSSAESSEVEPVLANQVAVNSVQDEGAEELLSRVIQKQDFEKMEILGQFNLGFIIVRSRRYRSTKDPSGSRSGSGNAEMGEGRAENKLETDDLFIVDQHAADEKYNFETLQQTTKIECQKLLRYEVQCFY